jgi:hypothetical protein
MDVKTIFMKRIEWGHVKTKKVLSVQWNLVQVEVVPIVSTTGLEVRTADRFLEFVRNNPNTARYSADNDPRRGKPVLVL